MARGGTPDRRAYIVDDDESVRRTVRRTLTGAGIYTEEFASAEAVLSGYAARPRGCIILDLRLPGMDGLELLKRLVQLTPSNPVVMLSGFGDISTAVQAVKLGAIDFLQKPFPKAQLEEVVGRAFDCISTTLAVGANGFDALTPRESEVLAAFADGASNKAVAALLLLSPRTIEMHRARILRKLDVSNLTQALLRARKRGISTDALVSAGEMRCASHAAPGA